MYTFIYKYFNIRTKRPPICKRSSRYFQYPSKATTVVSHPSIHSCDTIYQFTFSRTIVERSSSTSRCLARSMLIECINRGIAINCERLSYTNVPASLATRLDKRQVRAVACRCRCCRLHQNAIVSAASNATHDHRQTGAYRCAARHNSGNSTHTHMPRIPCCDY